MRVKTCEGCGCLISWTDATPEPIEEHCAACPPWTCDDCGEIDSYAGEPRCACWVSVEDLPLADVKAIFAADGTFNVGIGGALSASSRVGDAIRQPETENE